MNKRRISKARNPQEEVINLSIRGRSGGRMSEIQHGGGERGWRN